MEKNNNKKNYKKCEDLLGPQNITTHEGSLAENILVGSRSIFTSLAFASQEYLPLVIRQKPTFVSNISRNLAHNVV